MDKTKASKFMSLILRHDPAAAGIALDANGWAVNTRARVNVPFVASLTKRAHVPPNSEREMRDPYAERTFPWVLVLILIFVVGVGAVWYFGKLDDRLPEAYRSTTLFNRPSP